ncbi:MAG TPA: bifunctional DNA-formamidopyrimidine glycosylase/DNA-(apurinic or apyrimidinic site) lyase [Myxococcales bacterium]|nr:bifunctional DNA-formamidopyrimidine glycosylase/DNA-(apurinic or apyrimidinic site) lyase [Myxococcales bacterium]
MPELPEVEIASRQLRAWLDGHRIVSARAEKSRVIRGQGPQRFAALAGKRLRGIRRLGKWMLLEFEDGEGLISHLGMTGKWVRRSAEEPRPAHVRASLVLDDGHVLDYRDPRLFGRLIRGKAPELRELPALRALGPDPLEGIDVDRLLAALEGTKRSMKEALMDQRLLAGLGNIHVSESLHRAGIDPQRPGISMARKDVERLADAIVASLRSTLSEEDSLEPITYVEEGGENVFLVYDREGQPCSTCRTPIRRIVQGGRSTFYCPTCQPAWRRRATRRTGPVRSASRSSVARAEPGQRAPERRLRVIQGGRSSPRSR